MGSTSSVGTSNVKMCAGKGVGWGWLSCSGYKPFFICCAHLPQETDFCFVLKRSASFCIRIMIQGVVVVTFK